MLGTVCGMDSDGEEVEAEAFHWPSPVDLAHGNAWLQDDGSMGTISTNRKVRLVGVEECSRSGEVGGDMLLVARGC